MLFSRIILLLLHGIMYIEITYDYFTIAPQFWSIDFLQQGMKLMKADS